jgi:hypothetical protein
MSTTSLLAIVIVTVITASLIYTVFIPYSYSQPVQESGEQLWTDSDHDVKIGFM